MAEITTLREAVAGLIQDGDALAMEGFTHLIPSAAGHEVIRQGRRGLTVMRMTPDVIYDQLIGMGCVAKMIFAWGGNPGVGSLHRFRDAVERDLPRPLALLPGTATGSSSSAAPLPASNSRPCRRCGPDVAVIHAQQADRKGNVLLWGILGVQKEAVLAAKRAIVTVEEVVDALDARPNAVILPHWVVSAVCEVPGGASPSYAQGYYDRDNAFYKAWDPIARDRDAFRAWMERHVLGTDDFASFRRRLAEPEIADA